MRILMVNKFLYPNGGSETYLFRVGEELARLGHEVQYFGMEHEGRIVGNRLNLYTDSLDFHAGGAAGLLYPFRILYSFEAKSKITQVLRDFHPDVVHLNNINFQLTPSVIDAVKDFDPSVRIVYTAHDYQWICPNHMLKTPEGRLCDDCAHRGFGCCFKNRCIHGSRLRSLLGTMEARLHRLRHTYRKVDVVVCPSAFMEKMLSRNPDLQGRLITLHNFLDMQSDEAPRPDPEIVGKLPERYVLYFGRFDREKGIGTLLEAARALPDIPFVFAGKGEEEAAVRALPNGTFLGFLGGASLREVIGRAALSVYPSEWYENGPFSVVESAYLGTPVIASNLGGIPELISDGEGGILFPAGDARALGEAIEGLFSDEERCRRMGERAKRDTVERFQGLEAYVDTLVRTVYRGENKR